MENCNSRSNSQTRKGPDSGGKFPPDRALLYSRQSSRENYIKQIVPPCGRKQYLNPGTTWIPDLTYRPPTNSKSGGNDKVRIQKKNRLVRFSSIFKKPSIASGEKA
ncbi:hypothetical protein TNCV_1498831 [Trichonephila clavipes]|nr:hypothetical protein TNCV_1498831 [Trichonephila clavipes]